MALPLGEKVLVGQALQFWPEGWKPALQEVQSPLVGSQLRQLVQLSQEGELLVVEKVLAAQGSQVALRMYCPGAHWDRAPWTRKESRRAVNNKLKDFMIRL